MRTSIFVRALASRRSCNQPENVSLCLIVGILLLLFIRDSAPFDNQFQPDPLPILAGQDGRPPPEAVATAISGSKNCVVSVICKTLLRYLPGRSSRLSSPAATLRPTWPCTLSGCSAIELLEPPTSKLPPTPTPTDALPWAPA